MANEDILKMKYIFEFKKQDLLDIITFKKIQIFSRTDDVYNFYDYDGILYCICSIIDKKINGKYEEFNKGKLKLECFFKNDKFDGEFKTYEENGNLEIICNYNNDNLEGVYKKFYNNKLILICNYIKDKLNGLYKEYYKSTDDKNGKLKISCNYINNNYEGDYLEYYDNGQINYFCFNKNDNKHGKYKKYYKNGAIECIAYYNNDELHGEYKEYYPSWDNKDGYLKVKSYFINGNLHGKCEIFYENGLLNTLCYYNNDKLCGKYIEHYESNNNCTGSIKKITLKNNKINYGY